MFTVDDLIGLPYKTNGTPDGAFHDCWTIVLELYKRAGKPLNFGFEDFRDPKKIVRVIKREMPNWKEVSFADRKFLDVLLFSTSYKHATHVGLVLDKKRFIHCRQTTGVVIGYFGKGIYSASIKKVYRCPKQ